MSVCLSLTPPLLLRPSLLSKGNEKMSSGKEKYKAFPYTNSNEVKYMLSKVAIYNSNKVIKKLGMNLAKMCKTCRKTITTKL